MRRVSGILLIAIGLLHSLALVIPGAIGFQGIWREIAQAGFLDAVSSKSLRIWGYYWFLIPGFLMIVFGLLCHWVEHRLNHPVPAVVGWALFVLTVFGVLLDTNTGFWLVMAVAINIIVAAHRAGRTASPATN